MSSLSSLVVATVGLFFGITLSYGTNFSSRFFLVSLLIILTNFIIYKLVKNKTRYKKTKVPLLIIIFFTILSLGILIGQFTLARNLESEESFQSFQSQTKSFIGTVYQIKNTENSQEIFLHLKANPNWNLQIVEKKIPKYKVGDILSFSEDISVGQTLLPKPEKEINTSFNLETRNSLNHVVGELDFPKLTRLGRTNSLSATLKNSRLDFVETLKNLSPHVVAALGAGTTLGSQSLFSKAEIENFRETGVSHIIVLSGFNITVLILFFSFLFRQFHLNLKWRTLLTTCSIVLFLIFAPGGASLIRAAIMGSTYLLAEISGRGYLAKQALFLAAFVMMLINPNIVLSDVSFHLSFLATLGILYCLPILEDYKFFRRLENKNKFLKNVSLIFKLTLAVQILVIPYLMFQFGQLSIFALLTNILVVPLVPIVMLLTFLIILFAYLFSPLSILFGFISLIPSKFIFSVVEYFAQFSFSNVSSHLSLLSMSLIYLSLFALIYFEENRLRHHKYLALQNS